MVNVEGLRFICVGTVNSLVKSGGIKVSDSVKDLLNLPENWELKDTHESFITQEVKLLMENKVVFFQIEYTVTNVNQISAINVIQDEHKRICYHKES